VFLVNEMPRIEPSDACDTLQNMTFPVKYLDADEYQTHQQEGTLHPYMRIKDEGLKQAILKGEYIEAFTKLIQDHYCHKKVVPNTNISQLNRDFKKLEGNDYDIFTELFDFSDPSARMASTTISEMINNHLPMSLHKIKAFLQSNMGLQYKGQLIFTIDDKPVRKAGYVGIKPRENIIDDEAGSSSKPAKCLL
jgi:hypothetical protein